MAGCVQIMQTRENLVTSPRFSVCLLILQRLQQKGDRGGGNPTWEDPSPLAKCTQGEIKVGSVLVRVCVW